MRYAVAPAMVRHVTRWRSHDDGSQGISRAEYDRLAKLRLEALEASYDVLRLGQSGGPGVRVVGHACTGVGVAWRGIKARAAVPVCERWRDT